MSAVYDYEPSPRNDPMVSIICKYLETALPGLAPGKLLLVKLFPFRKCLLLNQANNFTQRFGLVLYVPDWMPGSWIRREAAEAYAWRNKMVETPYQYVRKRMVSPGCARNHKLVTRI